MVLRDDIARFEGAGGAPVQARDAVPCGFTSSMARRTSIDDRFFFRSAPAVIVVIARGDIDGALAPPIWSSWRQAHGFGRAVQRFLPRWPRALSRGLRRELGLGRKQKVVTPRSCWGIRPCAIGAPPPKGGGGDQLEVRLLRRRCGSAASGEV